MAEPHDEPADDETVEVSGGSPASGAAGGDSGPALYAAAGPEGEVADADVVSVAPFVDDDDDADDRETVAKSKGRGKETSGAAAGSAAGPAVTRRVVTSKRVTPKGGGQAGPASKKAKGQPSDDSGFASSRYTPPGGQGAYARGPSPWWVPTLMFGQLIIGALVIMFNYMGVFGDAQNIRLVIGLLFILGGIITATQYR